MAHGFLSPITRIVCAVNVYVGSFRHPLEQLHSCSMTCENSRQQVRLGENRGNSPRAALNLEIALTRTGGTDQQLRSEERRVGKECRSPWSPDHLKREPAGVRLPLVRRAAPTTHLLGFLPALHLGGNSRQVVTGHLP